jgi:hypothetical protein
VDNEIVGPLRSASALQLGEQDRLLVSSNRARKAHQYTVALFPKAERQRAPTPPDPWPFSPPRYPRSIILPGFRNPARTRTRAATLHNALFDKLFRLTILPTSGYPQFKSTPTTSRTHYRVTYAMVLLGRARSPSPSSFAATCAISWLGHPPMRIFDLQYSPPGGRAGRQAHAAPRAARGYLRASRSCG